MKFVVSKKPKEYLKQGPTGCGLYAIKGILSAYGKDDGRNPFAYWHGGILPFITTRLRLIGILCSYGFDAKWGHMRELSDEQKIAALQGLLRRDTPVMMHIGNGYRKDGIWSKLRWRIVSHWITLWGFDDEKGVFYIYDPCVPLRYHDKSIPVGNVQRTYQQVLRDGSGGPRWWWRYGYITFTHEKH
ncbi:MAG: hypothetical protein A3J10_03530 [Candidatus Sungbacteria bacterium RIFCSPLOWO2_02_FULL_54_10]|uniref:Peptidase C39-like domain-containing protein n=2 Tax=Candidatus Sungiibacteriota TaxID=1817917 RepID=A0A1G2L7G4_9BACT|nr:MAG: hypothetical protein A2679_03370 [Candidatus Sungbacteria bacterium RIFCSPHIGHO2_01_FULL_54_26]OHA02665.1 MAG: hypothetical protein A3C92_02470 [Candidatus Sungbacteria bacterium RIFCSPHIGHO2_02_FULL_53_17]OHA07484.1 MAG: hypothetical protein A3B34_03675 [Candidatus Sungbacteria bacterium RIFCSPLOWO2_01_FULL_54_21]OHA13452.1 MAG: hypothetical protein A3J10_03530 [Candidatus Sungbacteria bacterium RIFCSPLOWO2_02_FULL_54_10]